jgi:AcrR family transcriptional regulator
MARPGTLRRLDVGGKDTSSDARRALVDAAIETVKTKGFAGASARAIASEAGCAQGLVFYHFGSVMGLLLAALDHVSDSRLVIYEAAVGQARSPTEVAEVAAQIFQQDLDEGYARFLAEMIVGASSTPGLGEAIAQRMSSWVEFARQAIESLLGHSPIGSLLSSAEIAHGVVAMYLGLELLSSLDGDRSAAIALFGRGRQLTEMLEVLGFLPTFPLAKEGS